MMREYFIISRKLDIQQANTNLNLLHVVLIFIIMATVAASFWKIASMVLLLIVFVLVIYILTSEFLRMRSMHEDLKLACGMPE